MSCGHVDMTNDVFFRPCGGEKIISYVESPQGPPPFQDARIHQGSLIAKYGSHLSPRLPIVIGISYNLKDQF